MLRHICHKYGAKVDMLLLTEVHTYFLSFVLFLFQNLLQDTTFGDHILWIFYILTVPQTFLVSNDLADLKNTGQVFCRLSLNLACLMSFSCLDYGNGLLGGRPRGTVPFSSYNTVITWLNIVNADLEVKFLHRKVTVSYPLSTLHTLEESHKVQPIFYLRNGNYSPSPKSRLSI